MNMDWNTFNQEMQNMARSMQNHFDNNFQPPSIPQIPQISSIPFNIQFQQNNIPQQQHQIYHQHQTINMPQQNLIIPSIPSIPSVPINISQNNINNQQLFANQMNDFAQQITAYSHQMA
eukprot:803969_1